MRFRSCGRCIMSIGFLAPLLQGVEAKAKSSVSDENVSGGSNAKVSDTMDANAPVYEETCSPEEVAIPSNCSPRNRMTFHFDQGGLSVIVNDEKLLKTMKWLKTFSLLPSTTPVKV
ncbi:hypothetical protein GQ43DRAFT_216726 [Delitschia confertaspora ATCC 74209]|uniref:Uncharacterized protein n=1 Tax=Delitschia confertaspora ATCC 74209 TaxID=1513339 RepID=A0A9P4JD36_9PLEO|nr:hypothetical protein GQ43DRAFT_216726 [Delitschia confertaspora ATCC 74209]